MEQALKFLESQKILAIASRDDKEVWATNVYMALNDKGDIYFVSPEGARHSAMMLKNPTVAFATAWFNEKDHTDRKGIQGSGKCEIVKDLKKITEGIVLLNKKFPDLKKSITVQYILDNIWKSRMWVIRPDVIKYWDDELYGDDESKEFTFNT
ncbi:MAG: pyridoxamine 5'-phosphate oxidase family protein [Patescibacteria group bacterium]|nr:pyridoxamine 5'-phosphate oxidase family protein [Patescibacteria group bacterium]MDE2041423.1 pyridoxamine 5'-phosphate oxidase family protein [Patescibacteria group bacterium]